MPRELPRIWIITSPDHRAGPVAPLRRALDGRGSAEIGIQLRAKHAPDRKLIDWGRELRELTAPGGSPLVVNQRADVAQIIGADGVHLPETGLPIARVRQRWPRLEMIGVSRHDRPGLVAAQQAGATYAFLSPVFQVPGKNPPIGVDGFRRAIAGLQIPVFALGGIGPEDVSPLLEAGAHGVAVRRAVYHAEEPTVVIDGFLRRLDKSHANVE
ncbi:MAG: thiamine phosphate synthase [Myxococcales bacterium]|nr:thiamine phosphate synthase [Myxococcales bacterium]MDH3483615.1 thiamine phosphate synthase [Myxococcales bacterium]